MDLGVPGLAGIAHAKTGLTPQREVFVSGCTSLGAREGPRSYCEKIRVFKAGSYVRIVVHGITEYVTGAFQLVSATGQMIKRDCRGHWYGGVRGEILGSSPDGLQRKQLPSMFSLVKNESQRFEDDQIPS